MTTRPKLTDREEAALERQVFRVIAGLATEQVVDGRGDETIVLVLNCPEIPGEVRHGFNREAPAINVLRYVLAKYEESHAVR